MFEGLIEKERCAVRIARLRACWESLQSEVEQALYRKRNKGGQHVGVPAMGGAPTGILVRLARDCRNALDESDGQLEYFAKHFEPEREQCSKA